MTTHEKKAILPYTLKGDRFSSHSQIATLLQKAAKHNANQLYVVLDVGCAAGFLRSFLPAPDFYLIGVERDTKFVAQARQHYDEVYQAELTPKLLLPLNQQPQAVVFADILEHLPEPAAALTHVLQHHVAPGTRVIISLPNVAHLYVRLSLLVGRFDYTDRGILDRTHLRFFTMHNAQSLCAECGIRIKSLAVTPMPLPLVHPIFGEGQMLFSLHRFNAFLANTFKTLLGYQFILEGVYEPQIQ